MPGTMLADRALLRLTGEDVRGFLQGLVTSDVLGSLPVWAGLLTAQGKALFDFIVWADGEDVLLDCEAEQADALARRLTLYRLRRKITIARDATLGVHWWPDAAAEPENGIQYDPRAAWLGVRWIGPVDEGGREFGWRRYRLERGVTEGATELGSDRTLWLEANAAELNGVSFAKGCYVGQENTARMNWRAKVNRRLAVIRVAADPGEAARAWYPDLGLAVIHARVEALRDMPALVRPDWLEAALAGTAVEG